MGHGLSYDSVLGHVLDTASSVFNRTVSATDNFFDLGGDSVVAVDLVSRLADQLGYEPDINDLVWADDFGAFTRRLAA